MDRRKGGEGGSATSDTGCWASPRDGDAAGWQPGPLMAGTAVHNEPPGHPGWWGVGAAATAKDVGGSERGRGTPAAAPPPLPWNVTALSGWRRVPIGIAAAVRKGGGGRGRSCSSSRLGEGREDTARAEVGSRQHPPHVAATHTECWAWGGARGGGLGAGGRSGRGAAGRGASRAAAPPSATGALTLVGSRWRWRWCDFPFSDRARRPCLAKGARISLSRWGRRQTAEHDGEPLANQLRAVQRMVGEGHGGTQEAFLARRLAFCGRRAPDRGERFAVLWRATDPCRCRDHVSRSHKWYTSTPEVSR